MRIETHTNKEGTETERNGGNKVRDIDKRHKARVMRKEGQKDRNEW